MKKCEESQVDMSGFNEKHVQIIWQTLYDILSERGDLGDNQIIVKNVRKTQKTSWQNKSYAFMKIKN